MDVTAQWACVWEPVAAPHDELLTTLLPLAIPGAFTGREVLVPRTELRRHREERPARAGRWAYDALRVAAGYPGTASTPTTGRSRTRWGG